MDTSLDETQRLLRDSIREYLTREVPFDRIRELERDGGVDEELWRYLATSGFLGLPFAEPVGGGGSLTDLAVVLEELTARAAVIPYMETMAAAVALERHALSDAGPVLEAVAAGLMSLSPALSNGFPGTALPSGTFAGGRFSGTRRLVDYAQNVTHHLVSVAHNGRPALALVDRTEGGVSMTPLTQIGRTPLANVVYEDVPAEVIAGPEAVQFLRRLLPALTAIQCVGNAQQSLNMSVEYVSMRVQFGRPIGTFQAVQHHCANMATMTLGARFLAYEAVWKLDHGLADDRLVLRAKSWASKTATEVPMLAHQLHGGIGYTEEYDLHFFSRRGKDRATAWGAADECLSFLADTLAEEPAWR
jgi:3-oxocholest-4-en-26-oyl-CoA dehydrogenase beta subunit